MNIRVPVPEEEMAHVLNAVCVVYKEVNKDMILGHTRHAYIVEPRQIAMAIIASRGWTQEATAEAFNRKDHGTIWHARKTVRERLTWDKKFIKRVKAIRSIMDIGDGPTNRLKVTFQADIPQYEELTDDEKATRVARMILAKAESAKVLSIEEA